MNKEMVAYIVKKIFQQNKNKNSDFKDIFTEEGGGWYDDFSDYCYLGKHRLKYTVSNGATKTVILFEDMDNSCLAGLEDWVIKFDKCYNAGYCGREAALYEHFQRKGFEHFLCPIYYGGTIDGYPFYIAKRAWVEPDYIQKETYKQYEYEYEQYWHGAGNDRLWDEFQDIEPEEFVELMFKHFGVDSEAVDDLVELLVNHDVNDLHNENIGILDNEPVLIDYSGYHDEESFSKKYGSRDYGMKPQVLAA